MFINKQLLFITLKISLRDYILIEYKNKNEIIKFKFFLGNIGFKNELILSISAYIKYWFMYWLILTYFVIGFCILEQS